MGLLNQNNETKSNWEGINEKGGVIFEDQEHLFFLRNLENDADGILYAYRASRYY